MSVVGGNGTTMLKKKVQDQALPKAELGSRLPSFRTWPYKICPGQNQGFRLLGVYIGHPGRKLLECLMCAEVIGNGVVTQYLGC